MRRVSAEVRSTLAQRVREADFRFASMDDGRLYWDETAYYAFTLGQIERDIEAPTNELWSLCLGLAAEAVRSETIMARLGVPDWFMDHVASSWHAQEPTLYGRFDLAYDGNSPAKLLEINADTPTSIFEAAVFQWTWLEDLRGAGILPSEADQFNSLHERLIARWRDMGAGSGVHFVCMDNTEDRVTIEYLADCASQAGLQPRLMHIGDLGVQGDTLVDRAGRQVRSLFKLYPWEWLLRDPEGRSPALRGGQVVEPAWKMLLSNKAVLAELWRRHPGHPNLLAAYRDGTPEAAALRQGPHVSKPVHGREGGNVEVVTQSQRQMVDGPYAGPRIVQALAPMWRTPDGHAVLGSWVIGRRASGLGVREDVGMVTTNTARFIPHAIIDDESSAVAG